MPDAQTRSSATTAGGSPFLLAVYWLIVGVPLAWGVYQTVQKSIPLFHVTSSPVGGTPATITRGIPAAPPVPTMSAAPGATPLPAATPAAAPNLVPAESPFSTAQPTATVGPVVAPVPPTT